MERLLDEAASGALAARPDGVQDALYAIVRYPEPEVVDLLAARLVAAARALRGVVVEHLREAEQPNPREAAEGAGPIEGLAEALARVAAEGLEAQLAARETAAVLEAERRLEQRALLGNLLEGRLRRRAFLELTGERQLRVLGPRLDEARLCCEALGRLGDPARALPALDAYLDAEGDERRAAAAGLALCRLGGEEAARLLRRAHRRFGWSGPFADQVGRLSPLLRDAARALAVGDVEGLVERANQRVLQGDLEGALADYGVALELAPGHAVALGSRGGCLLRLGRPEEALRDLDAAVAAPRPSPHAFVNRARARLELGDARGALEDADRAVDLDVGSAVAWSTRGLVRWRLGDLRGAREDMDRAVSFDPQQGEPWLQRGRLRLAQGDADGAVADLTHALGLDPRDADGWNLRGVARAASGDAQGALDDHTRAVQLSPGRAALWFNRATVQTELGRLDAALADYSRAVELDPALKRAWVNRGDLRHRRGELQEAVADLDRALELDPTDAVATSNRGAIRLTLGDVGGWDDLRRAAELLPDAPQAHYRLASACFNAGRYAEACEHFDRVVALAPRHMGWRLTRAWARLLAGRRDAALEDLGAAAADPNHPKAAVWLAALTAGRPGGLETAARGEPPLRDVARFYLGQVTADELLRLADEVARPELRQAARAVAHAHLGVQAEARGDRAAAVEHYRAAVAEGRGEMVEHRWAEMRLGELGAGE
ncbi:MAG: tetratricopeptide repeat protein [Planctomycetes bacterium]|nr:tetratricopeptide repeat protein [Planctomycetota bacterium]